MAEGGAETVTLALPTTTPDATVTGPTTAVAGSTVAVQWTGPNGDNDYVSVDRAQDEKKAPINYTYTRDGTPLKLQMPPTPGTYEIRYILQKGRKVLARQTVEVTPVEAVLTLPDTATAGADIAVQWEGPNYQNDYISVATPESKDGQQINYSYTRDGTPLKLQMPPEPGTYEVRYVMSQDRTVIARKTIEVTAVGATLSLPAEATIGSTVTVEWTGPDYQNDYISVAEADMNGGQQINYTYTRKGTPLKLEMPPEPGTYEVRYILSQDRQILASQTINVVETAVTVEAPATAVAGSTVVVTWTGPDAQNDYISVANPDSDGGKQVNYTYTRDGSPLKLKMPPEPGTYEIRYIQSQGRKALARMTVTLEDVTATLDAPGTGQAGGQIKVDWVGPDYQGDYISIAKLNAADNKYETYTRTSDGSPLIVKLPKTPGQYEIRYVMRNGNRVLERSALTVE